MQSEEFLIGKTFWQNSPKFLQEFPDFNQLFHDEATGKSLPHSHYPPKASDLTESGSTTLILLNVDSLS
jgi:hypothetical protein